MKTGTKVLIAIAVVIIIIAGSIISGYNGLVSRSEKVNTASSQIDNQLQRRNDLIPNLVATVKQYSQHETEIINKITEARAKLAGANTMPEIAEADNELNIAVNNAIGRLLALAEDNPEIKANQSFIILQDELAGTENRIATARRGYNEAARDYNTRIRRFPTNILAGMFDFEKVDYFEASEGSKQNPNLNDLFDN
ncbi:MAG: LemA family protein [Firmicutes bacterium HGW-Firmicutes-21]|nr:MAG: LemA family protein [Firmicutes bacterium HGW-Firmicutes-21]